MVHTTDGRAVGRRTHRADIEPRRSPALPRAAHARGRDHGRRRHAAHRALRAHGARRRPPRAAAPGRPAARSAGDRRQRLAGPAAPTCRCCRTPTRACVDRHRVGGLDRRASRADVQYLRFPGGVDLPAALAQLRNDNRVRSILCEGGPHLNASLIAGGLIDELFLTTFAQLAGGAGALSIMDDAPLDAPVALRCCRSASTRASCSRATGSRCPMRPLRHRRRSSGCNVSTCNGKGPAHALDRSHGTHRRPRHRAHHHRTQEAPGRSEVARHRACAGSRNPSAAWI